MIQRPDRPNACVPSGPACGGPAECVFGVRYSWKPIWLRWLEAWMVVGRRWSFCLFHRSMVQKAIRLWRLFRKAALAHPTDWPTLLTTDEPPRQNRDCRVAFRPSTCRFLWRTRPRFRPSRCNRCSFQSACPRVAAVVRNTSPPWARDWC